MATYPDSDLSPVNGAQPDLDPLRDLTRIWPDKDAKIDVDSINLVRLPEVVVYEHINFGGARARTNLAIKYTGDWWNDKISSIVVVHGVWEFWEHRDYGGARWVLQPGYYEWVERVGIPNDRISSFKPIRW